MHALKSRRLPNVFFVTLWHILQKNPDTFGKWRRKQISTKCSNNIYIDKLHGAW